MRILITGASGFIGSAFVQSLESSEDSIVRLVRNRQPVGPEEISWYSGAPVTNITQLEDFDAVINLSGASIAARRWTPPYKRVIVESRTQITHELAVMFARLKNPPRVYVCASATGIYGDRKNEVLTEKSPPGLGFLAETCVAWEAAAQPARDANIRVAHLRFGTVLDPTGGALAKLLPVFRRGFGGRLGSGKQWMNWISLADAVSAISFVLQNELLSGPINVIAPDQITNGGFTRALARSVHRPAIFPVPGFVLRTIVGEIADEALLASTRAVPQKLEKARFHFKHPTLAPALEEML